MAESHALDHFMLATPDLLRTMAKVEQMTGVRAGEGGQHVGEGSYNALLSLDNGCYLELIGPDPKQDHSNNFGERLSKLVAPTMLMFGIQTNDIDADHARALAAGLWACSPNGTRLPGPIRMSRALPDGWMLRWRLLLLAGEEYALGLPFFIQWENAPHPSENSPAGCKLNRFWVEHPDAPGLAKIYSALSVSVDAVACDGAPSINVIVDSPKGLVRL